MPSNTEHVVPMSRKRRNDVHDQMPLIPSKVPETLSNVIQIGHLFQQRWMIQALIGEGGFGFVFRAYDSFTGKNVAIKFQKDIIEECDLYTEYCTHSRLIKYSNHEKENEYPIPHVYFFGSSGNLSFLVVDLLGLSIADFSDYVRSLRAPEVVQVGIRLLYALEYLHSAHIVHGDIKPENILMPAENSDFSKVRLIDFGLSTTIRDGAGNLIDGEQRMPGGTLDFLSRGGHACKPSLPADDVESLAYVLLELFTGSLPWTKELDQFEDERAEFIFLAQQSEVLKNERPETICADMPQFVPFLQHVYNMNRENPDYERLRNILRTIELPEATS